jgi:hypothetical protein
MGRVKNAIHHWLAMVAVVLVLMGLTMWGTLSPVGGAARSATAAGLSVFVGYAEDKETRTPDPAQFPVPWVGAPNTSFLGGTVPGQAACGTLSTCYDTGAIRLDNPNPTAVTVNQVSVDDHSSIPGGKVFNNLWGSFTVPAGKSVILTENPPADNPGYDNFDTSGFPSTCTPLTVAPTVTITIGGVASTLVDSTHVLDSGGVDAGTCSPKRDESIQWRPIGAPGSDSATLTLGPSTASAFAGQPTTETATLLDGGGEGIPNAVVDFTVASGPDAGRTGTGVTNSSGNATFTYAGAQGEDELSASVTTVGSFQSNSARILWTNDSATGWTGTDIGAPSPAGSQSFDPTSGTWTVSGGGAGITGTSDQFRFVSQTVASGEGVAARVTSQTGGNTGAEGGVMLRTSTDPASPYYAALVTPGSGIVVQDRSSQGGPTTTLAKPGGTVPAYLWVTNSGTSLTTYSSTDGANWTPIAGSTATMNLGTSLSGGLAATSAKPGALGTTTMNSVVVTSTQPAPQPPVPCPSPWSCADVGSPTTAGSQSFDPNSGTWTINAGGADITGTSDQFRFVWQTQSGDGSVSAHVTSQTNSSANAKAGVMLRATTDPASPYYAVLVSPGAGIKVQERSVQGGTTTKLANPTGTTPAYLEVARAGNTFTASTSPDGVSWTAIAGSTFTMNPGPTMLAGLAVTSHSAGQQGTVTMDTVTAS